MHLQLTPLILVGLANFLVVSHATGAPTVTTPNGILKGKCLESRNGNTYEAYLGIQYGIIPTRFKVSVPSPVWNGTKDATEFGSQCVQANLATKEQFGREDCLTVNVFTPKADNRKRPVYVFIHGGGYFFGSSDVYGGKYFMDEEVVLVTFNYRLGILGFLNTGDGIVSGNMGLKDQVLALKWVQKNIEAFGGDASRVTISGESAAAASVVHLVLSPTTKGLFHRAIAQSGTAANSWAFTETTLSNSITAGKYLKCRTETTKELVDCLRTKSVAEITEASGIFAKFYIDPMIIWPPSREIKSDLNPEPFLEHAPRDILKSGQFHPVPIIMTVNREEGSLFHADAILRIPPLLDQLNKDWERVAPLTLWFNHEPEFAQRSKEVTQKIRQFYFGKDEINMTSRENLINMYTDSWFLRNIQETALDLAKHTTVYTGLITHQRKDWSILSFFGISEVLNVTTHADELSYLFNAGNPDTPSSLVSKNEVKDEDDVEFSKAFVKTFVSFATSGDPQVAMRNKPKWAPVSKKEIESGELNYLNIGLDPYVHVNPFQKRVEFWQGLYKNDGKNTM